jgi:hypothetical protein
VDPRAGLDDEKKRKFLTLLGLELRPVGRPARSQSLYRLRYPGSSSYPVISLSCLFRYGIGDFKRIISFDTSFDSLLWI